MSRPHACPSCCGYLASVDALLRAPATSHRIDLRDALLRLIEEYERAHPDVTAQETASAALDVATACEEYAAMVRS